MASTEIGDGQKHVSDVAIVGLIGILGTLCASLGSVWLKDYLDKKRTNPAEEAAKALLRSLLNRPKWKWSSIETLANVVGADETTVRRLLLEIKARGSMRDGTVWGLISRNPIETAPDDPIPLDDPDSPG